MARPLVEAATEPPLIFYAHRVDWGTLIGTALGAVVGISSTTLAERSRWKRDTSAQERAAKRQLYSEYLAALSRTRNELRALARSPSTPADERGREAGRVFRTGGAYELRHQMAITAPEYVNALSVRALHRLRDLLDRLEVGDVHTEDTWNQGHEAFIEVLDDLRAAMRSDLGVTE